MVNQLVDRSGTHAAGDAKFLDAANVARMRHPWRWFGGIVVSAVALAIIWAFVVADIDYTITARYLFSPTILKGLLVTLELTFAAMLMGIVLGSAAAVMREAQNPVMRAVAKFYIWFFRGTPVLVQLLIWFNLALVFPRFYIPGIIDSPTTQVITPMLAALLGLGINEGAYMAEIVRSGLLSVGKGQMEAAQALGMTRARTMWRIVMPQALRVIVPPSGNELIMMLKTTALVYTISVNELLNSAFKIYNQNLKVIELLFTASIWYLVATSIFTVIQAQIENRLGRGYGATTVPLKDRLKKNLLSWRR